MADSDLGTLHHAFVEAMHTYQHEAILLQMTVSDLTFLAGTLHAYLRANDGHSPKLETLERILQSSLTQLASIDPVLRQWLECYSEHFLFHKPGASHG